MKQLNRILKSVAQKSLYEDATPLTDATISYNQGDLAVLDSGKIRAIKVGDDGSNFLGITRESIVNGKLKSPYVTDVDNSQAISSIPGPVYGVTAKLVLKTGDALNPGYPVYPDPASGTYHVTSTAGALKAIGLYQGPAIASALAGQGIEVLLGARTIEDVLIF